MLGLIFEIFKTVRTHVLMLKLSAIQLRNMSAHHQQFSNAASSQCDKVPCSPCPFLRRDRKKVIVLSESAERKRRRVKAETYRKEQLRVRHVLIVRHFELTQEAFSGLRRHALQCCEMSP